MTATKLEQATRGLGFDDADRSELATGLRVHGAVVVGSLAILAGTALLALVLDIPGSHLAREPQVTLDGPLYTGALSNLGALVWMVGVVMAAVGWSMTRQRAEQTMFLAGTIVGLVLLIDDFFLVHDWVELNFNDTIELILPASYFLMVTALLVLCRRSLGVVASAAIVGTLGLLAMSVLIDLFFNDLDQLIEDGFKFVGICTWTTAWILRAHPWRSRPGVGAGN